MTDLATAEGVAALALGEHDAELLKFAEERALEDFKRIFEPTEELVGRLAFDRAVDISISQGTAVMDRVTAEFVATLPQGLPPKVRALAMRRMTTVITILAERVVVEKWSLWMAQDTQRKRGGGEVIQ